MLINEIPSKHTKLWQISSIGNDSKSPVGHEVLCKQYTVNKTFWNTGSSCRKSHLTLSCFMQPGTEPHHIWGPTDKPKRSKFLCWPLTVLLIYTHRAMSTGTWRCLPTLVTSVPCCTIKTTAQQKLLPLPPHLSWKLEPTCVSWWDSTGIKVWDIWLPGDLLPTLRQFGPRETSSFFHWHCRELWWTKIN